MKAWEHFLIAGIFSLGFFLSSVMIDIDHSGSFIQKWKCAYKNDCSEDLHRGFLHKPIVIFSLIALFLSLGMGLIFHLLMDQLKFVL